MDDESFTYYHDMPGHVPNSSALITTLSEVLHHRGRPRPNFDEEYFMEFWYYRPGEHWPHYIKYRGRGTATANFICTSGYGHGPAEDIGGPAGWKSLLKAYDAPSVDLKMKRDMEWFQVCAKNNRNPRGLKGDLKHNWDGSIVNTRLSQLTCAPTFNSIPQPRESGPSILLVSLDKPASFDQNFAPVLAKLQAKANEMREVTDSTTARMLLSTQHSYRAIIVTDPSILCRAAAGEPDFQHLSRQLVLHAAQVSREATAVTFWFACNAGTWTAASNPGDKVPYIWRENWGLNWQVKAPGRFRQRFALNYVANNMLRERWDLKYLNHAYEVHGALIATTPCQTRLYHLSQDCGPNESPAMFMRYGGGYVGFIGDVNAEEASAELLLKMCGL